MQCQTVADSMSGTASSTWGVFIPHLGQYQSSITGMFLLHFQFRRTYIKPLAGGATRAGTNRLKGYFAYKVIVLAIVA